MNWKSVLALIAQVFFSVVGGCITLVGAGNGVLVGIKRVGYGAEVGAFDWGMIVAPLISGPLVLAIPVVIHFVWRFAFPNSSEPDSLGQNVSELVAAAWAWFKDKTNPKRGYTLLLELQDCAFDVTEAILPPDAPNLARIRELQDELSKEYLAAMGPPAIAVRRVAAATAPVPAVVVRR